MPNPIVWTAQLTVTSVVPTTPGVPGSFVASIDDPLLIVESPSTRLASITTTFVVADDTVAVPVQVDQTINAALRVV